ncbi:MAG: ABC transporter substrate-binding protein [Betaproteobacteria bacterium]|nr:ABC transporter substrate-binding protein [Betaproteobacteria bacterium]
MRRTVLVRLAAPLLAVLLCASCGEVWNDPYPAGDRGRNILYSAFTDRPKHLDPVQSYAEDEARFTQQIYEPLVQYHYLKRPYSLVPLTALEVPAPVYLDAAGRTVAADSPAVAYSVYDIRIRSGIRYQPHPAFTREAGGGLRHHALDAGTVTALRSPYDLPDAATRELTADDYIYQIKRLAHPRLHSPVIGLMDDYIVGLKDFSARLKAANEALRDAGTPAAWLDLREHALEGLERIDTHRFRIKVHGRYPQFVYWLAMPFFAPIPWEVEKFFHQPGMAEKNFNLDWWPVGTGPYMLTENNPNARMVLARNPNFRGEPYPAEGEAGDDKAGLLGDAGKAMPFIDQAVYSREKEGIPYWNKFLQGYYDTSGISSDNFDHAVRVGIEGEAGLTPEMEAKGISLSATVATTIIYVGFNWSDPVVGGDSERSRKLRQALSIAVDFEELLSIFANGRGIVAQGPLAPGIFGYREGRDGFNPVVYDWDAAAGAPRRKSLEVAKKLLAEAGYPDGRDARTGLPLVLYLDTVARGPGDKARLDWWRKQFQKLSIQLEVRDTDWNRFQEKLRKGSQQIFILGWNADYPDPENFLFLLDGRQTRVKGEGENKSNYANPEFDRLFERMKHMSNSEERQALIDRMVRIVRHDAPWMWGYHPKDYSLAHDWLANSKPNNMARNGLKYLKVDPARREVRRREWNRPVLWPLGLGLLLLVVTAVPAVISYRRRERLGARGGPQAAAAAHQAKG